MDGWRQIDRVSDHYLRPLRRVNSLYIARNDGHSARVCVFLSMQLGEFLCSPSICFPWSFTLDAELAAAFLIFGNPDPLDVGVANLRVLLNRSSLRSVASSPLQKVNPFF